MGTAMLSEERLRQKGCGTKTKFGLQHKAALMAIKIGMLEGSDMYAYQCPWCPSFHVGHRPVKGA